AEAKQWLARPAPPPPRAGKPLHRRKCPNTPVHPHCRSSTCKSVSIHPAGATPSIGLPTARATWLQTPPLGGTMGGLVLPADAGRPCRGHHECTDTSPPIRSRAFPFVADANIPTVRPTKTAKSRWPAAVEG